MKIQQNPNIIMIIIDAGRADYFSCYGFSQETTPNIDRFAKEGILFENVISTAPWTIPSHGSIFTSLYPHQHKANWQTLRLKEGIPTIFDIFTERGYETVAISANSLIVSPYSMFGKKTRVLSSPLHNDPDLSNFTRTFNYKNTASQSISKRIIKYLEENPLDKPLFIYINFYDLHAKYKARQPFYSRYVNEKEDKILKKIRDFYELHFQEMNDEVEIKEEIVSALRASYAARLAMIDTDLGKVFEKLKECGFLDNSIVIITSDHGDVLGDHKKPSFHHQFSIYNSLLKIPLIFWGRGINSPKRINITRIQNIDILPTILELCNMKRPSILDNSPGVSLCKYIFNNGCVSLPRDYAISIYETPLRFILRNKKKINPLYLRSLMAIQDDDYKLIFSDKNETELYYIKEDKNEKENVAKKYPQKITELKSVFYEIINKYKEPECKSKDTEYSLIEEKRIIQRLKSLGYLE